MTVTAKTRSGLAYEVAGAGPPVLLMHAGLMDRRMWDPQWQELAVRSTAIRFDARGFGDSSDPRRPHSLHGDALEVLDAFGVERAAVVGVSMGGAAALDLAIAVPHRVASLVVVSSAPSGWQHSADLINGWEAVDVAYETRGLDAANELEVRMWVDGPFRSPADADREVRRLVASVNRVLLERQASFAVEPSPLDPPASERLTEVRCPTLVVTGELDQPSVLAGAFELARGTGARHVEIEGAAHLPNLEKPHEFGDALIRFLPGRASG